MLRISTAVVMAGVLTGAAVAHDIGNIYKDLDRPQNIGHFFLALPVESFMPRAEFEARAEALIGVAHDTPATDESRPVLVPGEPEMLTSASREKSGIPLSEAVVTELSEFGEALGVAWPDTPSP